MSDLLAPLLRISSSRQSAMLAGVRIVVDEALPPGVIVAGRQRGPVGILATVDPCQVDALAVSKEDAGALRIAMLDMEARVL